MKKILFLLLFAGFLAGCEKNSSPVAPIEQSSGGNVALLFDKAGAPEAVQTLTTTLTRSGFITLEKTVNIISDTSAAILFEKVAVGTWKVKVDAKDGSGTIIYTGQSDVIVQENVISQLNLTLVPVSTGVGSVQINVKWGTGPSSIFPKTFGGQLREAAICVIQTKDGGYAIGGISYSYGSGGDAWLVKTNAQGVMQWQKNYGGSGEDRINNIVQTDDGGFLFVGYTTVASEDSWIVKLDSSGTLQWQKNYGKTGDDAFLILKKFSDGSYVTCGYSGDGSYFDGRVVKFNPSGDILWSNTYGGTGGDFAMNFIEQENGNIIVSGYNGSNLAKHYDFWLFKLTSGGNLVWEKMYGDSIEERSAGLVQLSNGTLLLSGYQSNKGKQDVCIMNIDTAGVKLWSKSYDIGASDFLLRLQRGPDNSVIGSGYTSIGTQSNQGLMMKMDNSGGLVWVKTYGGSGYDVFMEHRFTNDGKIICAGTTSSSGNGSDDYWLVKVDGNGIMQ